MIEVQGLTKLYGDFRAVDGLSFRVEPGQVLGLVGPNGAGKTTTLRALVGIIPATEGSIALCGADLAADPVAAKRVAAFIPDEPRLFDYLTVEEHLRFVARLYGVDDFTGRSRGLIEELDLDGRERSLPAELSRGMKQKLAIACGLIHEPRVILFDEPLTGLDPAGIRRMKDSIAERAAGGCSVIVSSHLLTLVEEICHRILILRQGRKVMDGTLDELAARFPGSSGGRNLEELFFQATGEHEEPAAATGAAGDVADRSG